MTDTKQVAAHISAAAYELLRREQFDTRATYSTIMDAALAHWLRRVGEPTRRAAYERRS